MITLSAATTMASRPTRIDRLSDGGTTDARQLASLAANNTALVAAVALRRNQITVLKGEITSLTQQLIGARAKPLSVETSTQTADDEDWPTSAHPEPILTEGEAPTTTSAEITSAEELATAPVPARAPASRAAPFPIAPASEPLDEAPKRPRRRPAPTSYAEPSLRGKMRRP